MKIQTFAVGLIVALISACSIKSNPPSYIEKTPTPNLTPFPAINNSQVTPTLPQNSIVPTLESFHSSEQNANFQVLNVQAEFRLIVRDNSKSLGILHPGVNQLQHLEISGDSPQLYSVKASPDGMYIAYIGEKSNDRTYINISTINGHKLDLLWKVKVPDETVIVEWLTNHLLAIWGQSSRLVCPDSISFIDISTGILRTPEHSMPILKYPTECIHFPAVNPSATKLIYPSWKLFDFGTGETKEILPDIQDINTTSSTTNFKWIQDSFSILGLNDNILNYVLKAPVESLPNQNVSIRRILLPGLAETATWSSPIWWSPEGNLVGLDLVTKSINPDEYVLAGQSVPTDFFVMDLKSNILRNYNLDRSVVSEESKAGEVRFAYVSPDEKFLAWTIYDHTLGTPIATKVLDLSNGIIALIRDVEVLGWGIEIP